MLRIRQRVLVQRQFQQLLQPQLLLHLQQLLLRQLRRQPILLRQLRMQSQQLLGPHLHLQLL